MIVFIFFLFMIYILFFFFFFFFFQAEDGIRDVAVTGVQTCALPIWPTPARRAPDAQQGRDRRERVGPVSAIDCAPCMDSWKVSRSRCSRGGDRKSVV